ncbi:DUF559 domain-containing protein [Candidatus Halobeggiatoa sp. HSG11]|nr:DUF559 domain-containing protein [Candidatus Halobeggiatoa sp. HSG11]
MEKRQAVHYGQVEIIPGIKCDVYVLNDDTPVMSERGLAKLLEIRHSTLQSMAETNLSKPLKPFIDKDFSMATTQVEVSAKNSPYQGRKIVVYSSTVVSTIIRAYAMAIGNNTLQKNQMHIGRKCVLLLAALADTALYAVMKEACGLPVNLQKTAQKSYTDIVELMRKSGLKCSVGDEVAIKTDITDFLDIPLSTLNSFLGKRRNEIEPIRLDRETIRAMGSKASRMNGYSVQDVGTIALGMDSVIGIGLKEQMFGSLSSLAKLDTKGEMEWQQVLEEIFAGFNFYHNYMIGKYKVDFFVKELNLVLECNGYENHAFYDQQLEAEREKFINKGHRVVRFHHLVGLKTLVNGILHAQVGDVVKLYDVVDFCNVQSLR